MDIDFVCCWVKLDDEYYENVKNYANFASNDHAFSKSRYRDNGELLHSFRALNRNLPWLRRIHIVTNGQLPPDEIVAHPKVQIHFHQDFFHDKSDLPTFNYHAIESNLFRLEGLADYYINSADDFFIGQPLEPSDFFSEGTTPKISIEPHAIPKRKDASNIWELNLAASDEALSRVFGRVTRHPFTHTPILYVRSWCEELYEMFKKDIDFTSFHKFRHEQDVIFRILYIYYVVHKKMGLETSTGDAAVKKGVKRLQPEDYRVALIGDHTQDWQAVLRDIISKPPTFFCLNDHIGDNDAHAAKVQEALFRFYDELETGTEKPKVGKTDIVVMAAGVGSRLMPLTATMPKTMVPVNGRPILDHILQAIQLSDPERIGKVVVVAGYQGQAIADFVRENYPSVSVIFNHSYASTNNMHSLYLALALCPDENDLITINGDCVYHPDIIKALISQTGNNIVSDKSIPINDESMKAVRNQETALSISKVITPDSAAVVTCDIYKFTSVAKKHIYQKVDEYESAADRNRWLEIGLDFLLRDGTIRARLTDVGGLLGGKSTITRI